MDQLEQFRILRELFSLKDMKNQQLNIIKEESLRVTKLENSKQEKLGSLEEAKKKLLIIKNDLGESQRKLEQLLENIDKNKTQLVSLIETTQINSMQEQIQKSENAVLELEKLQMNYLEQAEEQELMIEANKKYLSGIDETIEEYQMKFKEIEKEALLKIENLKTRFLETKSQLSPSFQSLFSKLNKKDFAVSPFTRLKSDCCEYCGMNFTKTQQGDVDVRYAVVTCSGCSRLLLPFNLYA